MCTTWSIRISWDTDEHRDIVGQQMSHFVNKSKGEKRRKKNRCVVIEQQLFIGLFVVIQTNIFLRFLFDILLDHFNQIFVKGMMEFPSIPNNSISGEINNTMSFLKDDDSPQQQINEQSITQDLQKTRDCAF